MMMQKISEKHGLRVQITEVDIVNDDKHDLSKEAVRAGWMRQIQSGIYDVVLVTPPCSTFTRARCANKRGPPPIRSKQHPRGFPWLKADLRKQAELGNQLVDVMGECYIAAAHARKLVGKLVLLFSEHPEDLGRVYREEDNLQLDPASIWQSESVRNLLQLDLDLFTVGFNQCCFGAPYKKPTHIISNIPELRAWGFSGWPLFDEANTYLGPIQTCGCQVSITLAKRGNSEGFRTTGTSAYPARMDESLAQAVVMALKSMLSSPPDGGPQESIEGGEPGPSEDPGKGASTRSGERGASDVKVSQGGSGAAVAPEVAVSHADSSRAAGAPEAAVSHAVQSSGVNITPEGSVLREASISGAERAPEVPREALALRKEEGSGKESIGTFGTIDGVSVGRKPLLAYYKGKHRMVHDGGGLCSPGRWPVKWRETPKGNAALAISSVFRREFLKWLLATGDGGQERLLEARGGTSG